MEYIKENTIGTAWLKAAALILRNGNDFYDGDIKLKEILDLFIEIESPLLIDEIVKRYGDQYMIEQLKIVLLDTKPGDWGWAISDL